MSTEETSPVETALETSALDNSAEETSAKRLLPLFQKPPLSPRRRQLRLPKRHLGDPLIPASGASWVS